MRIDELDEFQGLTLDMVHAWLTKYRWSTSESRPLGTWWEPPRESKIGIWLPHSIDPGPVSEMTGMSFRVLADDFGLSVQALLREINPRMRKGMPSKAARDAHPLGLWLALPEFDCIGAVVSIVVSLPPDDEDFCVWHPEGFAFSDTKPKRPEQWAFWPCDEHGNKVRWPTDSQGNML